MASPVSAVRPVVAEPAPAPAQKHVLLFMHDFSRTGVVLNAVRLANALGGRGHQVRFLVCNATGRADHPIDPEVVVEVAGEPAPRWLPRGLRLLAAIPTIRKAVRSARPDIFVSLGNHGHLPAMIALIRLAGMRKLLRMSNDADRIGDSALIRGVRNILLRWTIAAADQLMLVSPHLAQHPAIRRAEGQGKVVIVPNGIEIEEVRRRVRGARVYDLRPGRAVSVLAIGRLVPHKNFETLIRAIAVADRERSLHLTIIGGGSPAYRDKLEALAQSLGIEDRVKLLGEVDDPLPRLAAADVFVLPSLREGSSNVLLEALACGVPIVASRAAGNASDALDGGRFGLLVDPLDSAAMACAILHQVGPDRCLPADRATAFDLDATLAAACRFIEAS